MSNRMSASRHVGPGASEVRESVEQVLRLLDALDYGTPQIMFDGYMLVRSILVSSVEAIDDAVLARLKDEVGNNLVVGPHA